MRVKFEAIDATGKVHKRSSMSHVYSRDGARHRSEGGRLEHLWRAATDNRDTREEVRHKPDR